MQNKISDLILGVIIFLGSILILLESNKITVGAIDREIGLLASPKGYILIIGICLLFLSFLLIIKTIRMPAKSQVETAKKQFLPKEVFISMVVLIIYVATLHVFGFYINSFFLMMVTMITYQCKDKGIGIKNKKELSGIIIKALIVTLISLIVLQQLFVKLLGVILPRGFLGW